MSVKSLMGLCVFLLFASSKAISHGSKSNFHCSHFLGDLLSKPTVDSSELVSLPGGGTMRLGHLEELMEDYYRQSARFLSLDERSIVALVKEDEQLSRQHGLLNAGYWARELGREIDNARFGVYPCSHCVFSVGEIHFRILEFSQPKLTPHQLKELQIPETQNYRFRIQRVDKGQIFEANRYQLSFIEFFGFFSSPVSKFRIEPRTFARLVL